jgi:ribosomal protein S18 acetylase RimI-like enzyme
MNYVVRVATPDDFAAIGELTVSAYRSDGQTRHGHPYEPMLADAAARSSAGTLLVCASATGEVLGSVLFVLSGSDYAELSREGEAEFRMLAVAPAAQGQGVGEALVRACLDRAAEAGCRDVVICVNQISETAQRLYKRLGFVRDTSLDWDPIDGVRLLGLRYSLTPISS